MSKRLAAFAALLVSVPARATPWVTMGPRAMAMGGAFTAVADGPAGVYYNPGALGQISNNPSGIQMHGAGHFEVAGTALQGANDFYQVYQQCQRGGFGSGICTQTNINNALAEMQSPAGEGVLGEATGGLNVKFGRFAVFANNFSFRGVTPQLDLTPANTLGAGVLNNQSEMRVRGSSFYEFGAGYGHEVLDTGVYLGANVKGIVAKNGYTDFFVGPEHPEAGNVLRNYDRSTKISFMPGVDVGLLWDARETFPDVWLHPRIGFVGRNVNNPRFNMPSRAAALGDSHRFYDLQGQSRVGMAFDLARWWTVTSDLDITQNLTQVERYTSQLYGAGTEIRLFNDPNFSVPLRGGVSKNIAMGSSGTMWSMGFGLHLVNVYLDFAASLPERWQTVQTQGNVQRLPQQLALAASFSVLFGGADSVIAEPTRDPFAAPAERPQQEKPSQPYNRDPFRR